MVGLSPICPLIVPYIRRKWLLHFLRSMRKSAGYDELKYEKWTVVKLSPNCSLFVSCLYPICPLYGELASLGTCAREFKTFGYKRHLFNLKKMPLKIKLWTSWLLEKFLKNWRSYLSWTAGSMFAYALRDPCVSLEEPSRRARRR